MSAPPLLDAVDSPDSLWRELLLSTGPTTPSSPGTGMALLQQLHARGAPDPAATALLVLTDERWRDSAGELVRLIADSDLLSERELDDLAARLLWHDDVTWRVPQQWVELPVDVTVARRVIPPALRRWSAERVVEADPRVVRRVVRRIRELEPGPAAAALYGVLEAADHLPDQALDALVRLGVEWPARGVRMRALHLLADRAGLEAARQRAIADPDAAIRAWATSLPEPEPEREPEAQLEPDTVHELSERQPALPERAAAVDSLEEARRTSHRAEARARAARLLRALRAAVAVPPRPAAVPSRAAAEEPARPAPVPAPGPPVPPTRRTGSRRVDVGQVVSRLEPSTEEFPVIRDGPPLSSAAATPDRPAVGPLGEGRRPRHPEPAATAPPFAPGAARPPAARPRAGRQQPSNPGRLAPGAGAPVRLVVAPSSSLHARAGRSLRRDSD